jgi:hypothetical protein
VEGIWELAVRKWYTVLLRNLGKYAGSVAETRRCAKITDDVHAGWETVGIPAMLIRRLLAAFAVWRAGIIFWWISHFCHSAG